MSENRRNNFTGEFKAKAALEAIRGINRRKKTGVAPSSCMKKASILNSVHYCLDGGDNGTSCKTKSAVYPFISYKRNINAPKKIDTAKNNNKCCLNIALPRGSHFKVIQPLVLIKLCHLPAQAKYQFIHNRSDRRLKYVR